MSEGPLQKLSKRERQIMDIIYRRGQATAAEVRADIDDDISYSTVRALLNILERKGHLSHESRGQKYLYLPEVPKKKALKAAVKNLMDTFFNNSVEQAVQALLELNESDLTDEDFDRLGEIINNSRKEQ